MKRWMWIWAAGLCAAGAWAAEPVVSNTRGLQRAGTGYVDIGYDLADSDSPTLSVTVEVSTNGGAAYFTPASGLSGDVGGSVARGTNKKVVWNAGASLPPKLFSNVRTRVTASDGPADMVLIPAGSFSMGDSFGEGDSDELPVHSVYVSAFYMDKYEVTKAKWDEVYSWATSHGYMFDYAGSGKATTHPVQTVNWYDCAKWCNARSEKEGRTPCYTVGGGTYKSSQSAPDCNWSAGGYRLPTEAEWEKAARGGAAGQRFPWGNTIDHNRANYYGYPSSYPYDLGYQGYDTRYATGDYPYTSPVGSFTANGYGLYDMAGNVLEWCWDWWYGSYPSGAQTDPHGATSGSYRVLRGGCWSDYADDSRCALRDLDVPDVGWLNYGFRCVRGP